MKAPSLEHIKAKQSRGKSIILPIGYSYLFLLNKSPPPEMGSTGLYSLYLPLVRYMTMSTKRSRHAMRAPEYVSPEGEIGTHLRMDILKWLFGCIFRIWLFQLIGEYGVQLVEGEGEGEGVRRNNDLYRDL